MSRCRRTSEPMRTPGSPPNNMKPRTRQETWRRAICAGTRTDLTTAENIRPVATAIGAGVDIFNAQGQLVAASGEVNPGLEAAPLPPEMTPDLSAGNPIQR